MSNNEFYDFYLLDYRRRKSTTGYNDIYESLLSDRSRILYSSSFRRLQFKAQVFSLEDCSSIRSRLTHSLEVSDVGRRIAYRVALSLLDKNEIEPQTARSIPIAVENACLLHDIGNPPFGHFGESAIKKWFAEYFEKKCLIKLSTQHKYDFTCFDGNQQGLRIILRLHHDKDAYGLNLTTTTLLSYLKYPEPTWEKNPKYRKKGIFVTEYDDVVFLWERAKIPKNTRHPLVYLVEAADDIAYCISDIEDSVEKNLITPCQFIAGLMEEWQQLGLKWADFPLKEQSERILKADTNIGEKSNFFDFKVSYTRHLIVEATRIYQSSLENKSLCDPIPILERDSLTKGILEAIKNYSRKYIFRRSEAEDKEVAGFKIISGILDVLLPLLQLPRNQFLLLLQSRNNPSILYGKHLDYEWRLFNKLPFNYISCYQDTIKNEDINDKLEMFHRCHLLVDSLAGMTDRYSLETYQLLQGIRI